MRIQHNIMAMNAYRNYTGNVNAMKSNLEKLSSGYKINRAGDDAAGLAISEKMRAQITGLSAAQKNVKDGISLVQTAEGAMQEVQDMLNRMVYLATQSANGTYDDEVDRNNLQKELDQLRGEIDRISDSANFNGIKLLDGSKDTGAKAAVAEKIEWGDAANIDGKIADAAANGHESVGGTNSVVRKDGVTEQSPSFSINLADFKYTATDAGGSFKVTVAGKQFTIDDKTAIGGGTALAKDDVIDGETLATMLATEINKTISTTVKDSAGEGFAGLELGGMVYKATAADGVLTFELSDQVKDGATDAAEAQTIKDSVPQATVSVDVTGAKGDFEGLDTISHGLEDVVAGVAEKSGEEACAYISLAKGDIKDGTKLTIGNKTYTFQIGKDSKVADGTGVINMKDVDAGDANLLDKAIAALTNETNDWFTLSTPAAGKLVATAKGDAYKGTGDLTTIKGLKSNFSIAQMTVTPAVAATEGDKTKGLTFQIGDTAEGFNQLNVSIGDIHCEALGIDQLKISDQKSAQDAVQAIKDAINTVSSIRGDLGATQNRLEHTQNNLSVMQENITDAESSIRDTDVAEEMMAYTKNNILIQAAQAMLAQANQIPQGVLQLLQ